MSRPKEQPTAEMAVAELEDLIARSREPELPCALGPSVLLHQLAAGPYCSVYLGTNAKLESHGSLCIVKSVDPTLSGQPGFRDRFAGAVRRLVHLDHRNVAQVFDSGEVDGSLYLAREHVVGCRLDELRGARGATPLPLDLALLVAADVLRGLYHALRQPGPDGAPLDLWHGRLLTRSVLLSTDGEVKLIGFDREWEPFRVETAEEERLATVEEAGRGPEDGRKVDVFAAGCLLESILREPLSAEDARPEVADVAMSLGPVIARATSPDAAHRPVDVGVLLRPVRAALHRVNPWCGPRQLAEHLRRALGETLLNRAAFAESLFQKDAEDARIASQKSTRRTRLLLEADDEPAGARAVERALARARAAALCGVLPGTRYRILRPIGEGGMGTVYAAEHVDLEKLFAVKILHRGSTDGQGVGERLRREARAASRLRHPNIVSVSDFGETPDGRVFFVMEHLEGASLGEVLATERVVDQVRAVDILVGVCDGLAAAHEAGVVHRDIKPDNIFLAQDGGTESVKILDFGVAFVTQPGTERPYRLAGTPPYMSPEMVLLRPVDGRSDLYSLGVVAYEMLAGRRPFGRAPLRELLRRHVEQAPEPLRAPPSSPPLHPALVSVVDRALRKKPWERFPDARSMAEELRAVRALFHAALRASQIPASAVQRSESVQREIDEAWSDAVEEFLTRGPGSPSGRPGR